MKASLSDSSLAADIRATSDMVKSISELVKQDATKVGMLADMSPSMDMIDPLVRETCHHLLQLVSVAHSLACAPQSTKPLNHQVSRPAHEILDAFGDLFETAMSRPGQQVVRVNVGRVWNACDSFREIPLSPMEATRRLLLLRASIVADALREAKELTHSVEPDPDDDILEGDGLDALGLEDGLSERDVQALREVTTILGLVENALKRVGACLAYVAAVRLRQNADTPGGESEWLDRLSDAADLLPSACDDVVCLFMDLPVEDPTPNLLAVLQTLSSFLLIASLRNTPSPDPADGRGTIEVLRFAAKDLRDEAEEASPVVVRGYAEWLRSTLAELDKLEFIKN